MIELLKLSKKEKTKNVIKTIIVVIICSAAISISTAMFLNPLDLYAGGVTGIAQIILHLIGILTGNGIDAYMSWLGLLNLILLMPFNILAYFKLSKKYAFYTGISSIVQTIILSFPDFWENLNVFKVDGKYDFIACSIVAGLIGGLCNGLLMRRGATSGGIITLCQYLNIKKGKSVGFINLITSGAIMIMGATISFIDQGENAEFGPAFSIALYTFINFLISSLTVDYVHTAYNKAKLEVVTEKGNEIAEALLKELPHGITIERGIGAFSGREKSVLNVIIQNYETSYYVKIIKEIDQEAFVSVLPCRNIFGKFNQRVIDR